MTSSEDDAIYEARALLGEYEQFLSGKAQGTMDAYLRTVRHLIGWVAQRPGNEGQFQPAQLTQVTVELYLVHLVLQRHLLSSSRGSDRHLCWLLQDLQHASPATLFAPALIATGHRLPGPEACGQLAPRRPRAHDPQDALHDQTMLDGGTPSGCLWWQEWPQLFPVLRRQCLQTCQVDGLRNVL